MPMAQCQQLYEPWKKARLIKGKKSPDSSKALEARVSGPEAKTDSSTDEKPKANNRKKPALDRKGHRTRQSCRVT